MSVDATSEAIPEATPGWTLERLLGDATVAEIARGPVDPASVTVTPEPYAYGSPATGGLFRVRGRRPDGAPWSSFVKVLQHVRHWPFLRYLPPEGAEAFLAMFPWQEELAMWEPAFTGRLPAGLRVPELYRLVDLGDDRVAVWAEEVDADGTPWDEARFARAAHLLGMLGARLCDPEVMAAAQFEPDLALRQFAAFGLPDQGFRPLADDALWAHPLLRGAGDVRARLQAAVPLVDAVLERFAGLRHGMPHGDASPQNLLVPRDGGAEFVVIDISFQTPSPLGTDLGQLVVGLGHAGLLAADRLRAVEDAVLPAYADGVAAARPVAGDDDIALGYAGSLLIRSGFTAIPYRELDGADPAVVAQRLDLTRFVLDAADRHLGALGITPA